MGPRGVDSTFHFYDIIIVHEIIAPPVWDIYHVYGPRIIFYRFDKGHSGLRI